MLRTPMEGRADLDGGDDRHFVHLLQILFHGAAFHLEHVLVRRLQLESSQLLGIPVSSSDRPPSLMCGRVKICTMLMFMDRFSIGIVGARVVPRRVRNEE